MTREEAIEALKHDIHNARVSGHQTEQYDMAIKALEQEPCDDAISRQAVMDCFKKWQSYMATRLFDFEKELKSLPSVTPQQKVWRWIEHVEPDEAEPFVLWICEHCGTIERIKNAYCPYCGAKMEVNI